MAAKEKKAPAKKKPEVQPDQFKNTNDWPLYRSLDLYRVKQMDPAKDEHVMVSDSGKVTVVSEAELLASFEPVKGLHKREF